MGKFREKQCVVSSLELKEDYEGRAIATLIESKLEKGRGKAILYIHGFVDYFFQIALAEWANCLGFDFYAIELRKYGRSILPHQKPNNFREYTEYFEELDLAVDTIRKNDGNEMLVLMGHSTGGLIGSLYAHHRRDKGTIDALILNSPFFDFNMPALVKKLLLPLTAAIGKHFPDLPSPEGLKPGYPISLHKDYSGEWDFDLSYKPIEGFPLNFGWINAIHTAQQELQKGLKVAVPVLVMHASRSVKPGKYSPEMKTADAVLNVEDIARFARVIGKNTEVAVVEDGLHDLLLSTKHVREVAYNAMREFLRKHALL
ncbi:MAG: alpha/beta fold hydrolase [Bacteroidales bacterium]|nr:alpha/beta fold hydrolase [Bacteroidales bacterium]